MLEGREFEAAAVAARLRDFRAQPERYGPRYLQGLEPLPDGGIVLRLAQGRVPAALQGLAAEEVLELRAAAGEFVRGVCLWPHANHYQVLCARREAAQETVKENYHLLMALLHPDRQEGASDAWPADCAQRVNLAYAVVGDEASRREYDAKLRAVEPRQRRSTPRAASRRSGGTRLAKTLIAVGAVAAALIVVGLAMEGDEWGERSVLQASLSRLGSNPRPGSDRPRYVGSSVASSHRASDAVYDEPEPFALLKPLLRMIAGDEAKAWAPAPKLEPPVAASPVPAAAAAAPPLVAQAAPQPPTPAAAAAPQSPPAPPLRASPAATPLPAAAIAATPQRSRATNREIEDLVVALVDSYQAGDTERLVGLLEPGAGFWRAIQMRRAYSDFFRATRSRKLRIEKLAWDSRPDAAQARGEATVQAEYFGETDPVERRVDVELDIVLRDGQARIRRLSLFPDER